MQVTEALATKVRDIVKQGLVRGLGSPIPGEMCVEAAVCYAMGLPHSDKPTCVGEAVRSFKIALNDSVWSSKEARAKGMLRISIAQLGSEDIDQTVFVKELALQTTKQIVPLALHAAAFIHKDETHKAAMIAAADKCAAEGTEVSAREGRAAAAAAAAAAAWRAADADAADAAWRAADAAAAVAAAAAWRAADADAAAAWRAADAWRTAVAAAADAWRTAVAAAAAWRAADAAAAWRAADAWRTAVAAADAWRAADAAAAWRAADAAAAADARDEVLSLMAEIGVQSLIKAGSPGCEFLHLAA